MKSKTFEGKDKFDLDQQVVAWRSANPKAVIKKTYPDENLPVHATKPTSMFAKKDPAPNLIRRRIDYED